jgi:L-lactate dehydrogenase complex protein LldG
MTDARAELLGRIRTATDGAPPVAVPTAFRTSGVLDPSACVPAGLPDAWRPPELELVDDRGQSPLELDRLDGVITGCTVAIAETGTIVLSGGAREGRRAITLVPDIHICVVEEAQIVELVPQAFAALADLGLETRPLTFVSGPSATSDIELSRVEGVHGPRNLIVLVVKEPA